MRQVYGYHPVIDYRSIPSLKARIPHDDGSYLPEADESVFRSDRPFRAPAAPSFQRILMFGDSFMAVVAVDNQQRYSDLREKMLRWAVVQTPNSARTKIFSWYAQLSEQDDPFEGDAPSRKSSFSA